MKVVLFVASCCGWRCLMSVCICVCVADCPEVTSKGLQYLNSLSGLQYLALSDQPSYWLTDDKLQGLYGWSQLERLHLGDQQKPIQTNITAAGVTGSVILHTHRQLYTYTLRWTY